MVFAGMLMALNSVIAAAAAGVEKLKASDLEANDNFGYSVAIDGDTAVVGAYREDSNGTDDGAVYVFTRSGSTWTQQAKLISNEGGGVEQGGYSVAIEGDTIAVGAPGDDTTSGPGEGAVFVFVRGVGGTWSLQQKLKASDYYGGDRFGHCVAISGDTIVTGAPYEVSTTNGSVYVFTRSGSTWSQQQKLVGSSFTDNGTKGFFGWSCAIDGNTMIIGAYQDPPPSIPPGEPSDSNEQAGTAFIFTRASFGTSFSLQQEIQASVPNKRAYFGTSVGIGGDTVAVGSPGRVLGSEKGGVYAFVRSGTTWSQQALLTASEDENYSQFGRSVGIHGDYIVGGASTEDAHSLTNSGSAYLFTRDPTANTWSETTRVVAGNPEANAQFGWSSAIRGTTFIAGAPFEDTDGTTDAGAAYVHVYSNTVPLYEIGDIVAFHYGSFDNVYGDGDVITAAENGHIYDDTPSGVYPWGTLGSRSTGGGQTTYTWTPPQAFVADVLMVAGGGAGASRDGGGGGAGGLLFYESQSIDASTKTVVVGNGGQGTTNQVVGQNGFNTSITGIDTVIGGGGAGWVNDKEGNDGGSGGGGGGGGRYTGGAGGSGEAGPPRQGNDGGAGRTGSQQAGDWAGGGGGGALTPGQNAPGVEIGGAGGSGRDFTTYFGTNYGDSGYFGGGGGGGGVNTAGAGGIGGGAAGVVAATNALDAQKHTGGGGGAAREGNYYASSGGSGIVLVKFTGTSPAYRSILTKTNTHITIDASRETTLTDALGQDLRFGSGNHFSHTTVGTVDAWLIDDDSIGDAAVQPSTGNVPSFIYSTNGYVAGWFFFPQGSNFTTKSFFGLVPPNRADAHFIFQESSGSVNIRTGGVNGNPPDPQLGTGITVNKGEWVFLAYLQTVSSTDPSTKEHRAYDTAGNIQTSSYSGGLLRLAVTNRTAATAFSNNYDSTYISGVGINSTNQFYVAFYTSVYYDSPNNKTRIQLQSEITDLFNATRGNFT